MPSEAKSPLPTTHDKAIADAAVQYVKARRKAALGGGQEACDGALDKLLWMVDANDYGWNPDDYRPEDGSSG